MVAHIYKPRRRRPDGKVEISRLYRARIRLAGEARVTEVALHTSDRQAAERKLAELVTERERERAGLIAPRLERDAAQIALSKHQEDFAADLLALGRTPYYVKAIKRRFALLARECNWRMPGDIAVNEFVAWRAQQTRLGPKTVNEYLNAANALLNWMLKQGRISTNPLKNVAHVDVRGKQQLRRAFTDTELDKLLAVASPEIRLLYLAAAFTGLRVGALRQVVWGDVRLDHAKPHIVVRAGTTKNRREATVPLHPQLVHELQAIQSPDTKPEAPVFSRHRHPHRRIRIDMAAAGIARVDGTGRKLDFHALRYTFATKLAVLGISGRLAQELMRHRDPRMTANIYTDVSQLPTFAAVNALAWQGKAVEAQQHTGTGNPSAHTAIDTAGDPHFSDISGLQGARTVSMSHPPKSPRTADRKGFGHVLASFATKNNSLEPRGLEGSGPLPASPVGERDSRFSFCLRTAIDPHEAAKSVEALGRAEFQGEVSRQLGMIATFRSAASDQPTEDPVPAVTACPLLANVVLTWPNLPENIKRAIVALAGIQTRR